MTPKEANKGDFICEINGIKWYLGPEASESLPWNEAMMWAHANGCVLPSREVLLMCYINKDIRKQFKEGWHWSCSECEGHTADYAWGTDFSNGYQANSNKHIPSYVRGVISSQ